MLKLDHIIIAVKSLEESAARWAQTLNTQPVWHGTHPAQGTANVLFNFGDFYLELMGADANSEGTEGEGGHAKKVRGFIEKNGEGIMGLCFCCEDIEATAARWRKAGLDAQVSAGAGKSDDGKERKWSLAIAPVAQTEGLFLFGVQHRAGALPRAEQGVVKSLDHTVIMTAEPDKMKALLENKIGLRVGRDVEREDFGMRQVFFSLGNKKFLELASPLGGASATPLKGKENKNKSKNNFWGLAWRVADIETAHSYYKEQGFSVSEVRKGRQEGTRVFTLRNAPNNIPTLIIGAGE